MKIQNINGRQNFGWRLDTHCNITSQALKHFPNLQKYEDSILLGVDVMNEAAPCTNIMKSMNVYSGGENRYSSFFPKTSFDTYYKLMLDFVNYFEDGDVHSALKNAGETIQILQDVASPLTTKKETNGLFHMFSRAKFERIADNNPQFIDIAAAYEPRRHSVNFYDIFHGAYKKSKQMGNPFQRENKKNMPEFVKLSMEHAYDATVKFFRRFELFWGIKQSKKDEFLLQEVENSKIVNNILRTQKY